MDFYFKGVTESGEPLTGEISAGNIEEARRQLTKQCQEVLRIRPLAKARQYRLSATDLPLFFNQIGELLKAGMSFYQALDHCARFPFNKRCQRAALLISHKLERGIPASKAVMSSIARLPFHIETQLFTAEQSGTLVECIDNIHQHFELRNTRAKRVKKALTQPFITLLVAISVAIFMVHNLLPAIANIYQDPTTLPPLTQSFMSLADRINNLSNSTTKLILWLAIITIGLRLFIAREGYYYLPITKPIAKAVNLQRTLYHLSILLNAGSSMREALTVVIDHAPSKKYQQWLSTAKKDVEQGMALSQALRHCSIAPEYQSLIATSELSGTLGPMLGYCAWQIDERLFSGFDKLIQMVQPIATLLVGLFIAVLIAAMYLPLFDLSNSL